ncbi:cell division protein FtsA [Butyrivibrio sp. MC2013]|uniref:cell division protein FtsA n=1 Tax=Butyrivibrio sp. MC2013 TaxID=1280686 RepID=UPI0004263F20|nr:cell division protein FtsA [Butyrivibrio sp. MC2013]
MPSLEQKQQKVVFGLDIGTRNVVGTIGYLRDDGKFYVIAQKARSHESRAMLDGQIHDINKVSATIRTIKNELETDSDIHLTDVCIAAAGRVLRTVETSYEEDMEEGRAITDEDIYNLDSKGVEKAYQEFLEKNKDSNLKFYLVGYSVLHYYLNDYQIANLEGHNSGKVRVELIATFLPDDVVDGLYKACERAELNVANLTLEPIAAIMVAIPEKFRLLNLALIDVGAGTSDICVTKEGTITAYGMIPTAGDHLTESIAQHCLVDFNTADKIKVDASHMDTVEYTDIMGLTKTISRQEVNQTLHPLVSKMAKQVTGEIRRLNGGEPVSAVFVVGGGGRIDGYTSAIASDMGISEERVALRGDEVMKDFVFLSDEGPAHDSLMVTPLGICKSYYTDTNNFVFVSFNGVQTKIYDNGKLQIVDAAMQAAFPNEDLFPKRGEALTFTVNGQDRVVAGEPGESAVITLNGKPADIHSKIHANDIINVKPSTAGLPGTADINSLPEYKSRFKVIVNGKDVEASRFATVGGQAKTPLYQIMPGDEVKVLDYDTAAQIAQLLDIEITEDTMIVVNNEVAGPDTPVYENFKIDFKSKEDAIMEYYSDIPDADEVLIEQENEEVLSDIDNADRAERTDLDEHDPVNQEVEKEEAVATVKNILAHDLHVICNGSPITLHNKADYIFVDIFDYIDFDLSKPQGKGIVTLLNGQTPDYMQSIKEGDKIEVYWT